MGGIDIGVVWASPHHGVLADPPAERRESATAVRQDQLKIRMPPEQARVEPVGDVAGGVEGKLDDRTRPTEPKYLNARGVNWVDEHRYLASFQFGEHRFQKGIAEVMPGNVGGQHNPIEAQLVQDVRVPNSGSSA